MKKFHCECCGAALPIPDRYQKYIKCSFCDATYKLDKDEQIVTNEYHSTYDIIPEFKYILVEPGHIQKYAATVSLTEEQVKYYPPEILEKFIRESLSRQITEFLMKEISIRENYDIMNMQRIYQTMIRIDTRGY